jgi:hypothetical protein
MDPTDSVVEKIPVTRGKNCPSLGSITIGLGVHKSTSDRHLWWPSLVFFISDGHLLACHWLWLAVTGLFLPVTNNFAAISNSAVVKT